jgi:hypothetical protein
MLNWKLFPSVLPVDSQLCYIRRFPESCPANLAIWDEPNNLWHVQPDDWDLPWLMVLLWAAAPAQPQIQPPSPPYVHPTKWRDVFTHQPTDGQLCWVRRFNLLLGVQKATWRPAESQSFTDSKTGGAIPWYIIESWRPVT